MSRKYGASWLALLRRSPRTAAARPPVSFAIRGTGTLNTAATHAEHRTRHLGFPSLLTPSDQVRRALFAHAMATVVIFTQLPLLLIRT